MLEAVHISRGVENPASNTGPLQSFLTLEESFLSLLFGASVKPKSERAPVASERNHVKLESDVLRTHDIGKEVAIKENMERERS